MLSSGGEGAAEEAHVFSVTDYKQTHEVEWRRKRTATSTKLVNGMENLHYDNRQTYMGLMQLKSTKVRSNMIQMFMIIIINENYNTYLLVVRRKRRLFMFARAISALLTVWHPVQMSCSKKCRSCSYEQSLTILRIQLHPRKKEIWRRGKLLTANFAAFREFRRDGSYFVANNKQSLLLSLSALLGSFFCISNAHLR